MSEPNSSDGLGVDSSGGPVVDPTRNVLDLVQAAIQRQDDLRHSEFVALSNLTDSRFKAIDERLEIIESRRVEQKIDTKVAVDAALSAAEKAVKEQTTASEKAITKSETAAAEQSKQQNATFTAALKGVTDVLADLKDRVVKIEAARFTSREGTADRQNLSNTAVNLVGIVFGAIVVAISLYAALHK